MNTIVKTPVTVATIYVNFSDDTPNGTHNYLFFGKPTKKKMKTAFEKAYSGNSIKKSTIVDVARKNLEIELSDAFLVKTVEDLIIEFAHNELNFESTIID